MDHMKTIVPEQWSSNLQNLQETFSTLTPLLRNPGSVMETLLRTLGPALAQG